VQLERAINSIKVQSYKDWKLLIVNDGSTRFETIAVLDAIYDERIEVFSQKNGGPSQARNLALSFIKLDSLVAYCDSDDYWEMRHLEAAVSMIEQEKYDLVYSNPKLINDEGDTMYPNFPLYSQFDWTNLQKGNFIFTPTVVHKNGLGFFDYNLDGLEDYDYWIRAVKAKYLFYQMNGSSCVCTVRSQGNNNMSSKGQAVLSKVKEKHKDFFELRSLL